MTAIIETLRDSSGDSRQLPPPGMQQNDQHSFALTETPGINTGSFSFEYGLDNSKIVRRYPRDSHTGLPLPLIDTNKEYASDYENDINYHHHFYYRRDPNLEGKLRLNTELLSHPERIRLSQIAGLAVRMSRGQILKVGTHNEAHRRFGAGPVLPVTLAEKYRMSVLACAGVLSPLAVDVTRSYGDEVVEMDRQTFVSISNPKTLGTEKFYLDRPANYRRHVLGSFFIRYAARQDFHVVSTRVVDEFLSTRRPERKQAPGSYLLKIGTELSVEPLREAHLMAKKSGYIQPGKPNLLSTVRKCIHPESYSQAFNLLTDQLLRTVAA